MKNTGYGLVIFLELLSQISRASHSHLPDFEFAVINGEEFTIGAGSNSMSRGTIFGQYEIQTTEVSQRLWSAVMQDNPSANKGPELPVESVTWEDAIDFISRLNRRPEIATENHAYRLPNEHEWEFAARGAGIPPAQMQAQWFFGCEPKLLPAYAWFKPNSGGKPSPVLSKAVQPNPAGIHGMYGNVWEWTSSEIYREGVKTSTRVVRGGSFVDGEDLVSSNSRRAIHEAATSGNVGFRLVRVSKDGSPLRQRTRIILQLETERRMED